MNMEFKRKLPTPKEIKEMYPISDEMAAIKAKNDEEIQAIFTGIPTSPACSSSWHGWPART